MRKTLGNLVLGSLLSTALLAHAGSQPPWSGGKNNPASDKGFEFTVPGVDNLPDVHGDPLNAKLVLFIGGNQFMALPQLVAAFEAKHPELKGRIFYETLPPGILEKQMAHGNVITFGNMTLRVQPDVYAAGKKKLKEMTDKGYVVPQSSICYVKNDLAIMVRKGNPKHIQGLKDLGRPDVRVVMPNPAWEGIARQIQKSYEKAGGEQLVNTIMKSKTHNGQTFLTQIHHRQTPMRIMENQSDAGVAWTSESRFQEKIGNPISHVTIPAQYNTEAIYSAGLVKNAPHPQAARDWLKFLQSAEAQRIYQQYGFQPVSGCDKPG